MTVLTGQCMCGAVTAKVTPSKDFMTACNCENCQRWTGGPNFTFNVDEVTAQIDGPVKTVSIMPWAERGFCSECGSGVLYRVTAQGPNHGLLKMSAGLFPDATGLPLGVEYYVDQRPAAFDLSQPHDTMTTDEVNAMFAPSDKENET